MAQQVVGKVPEFTSDEGSTAPEPTDKQQPTASDSDAQPDQPIPAPEQAEKATEKDTPPEPSAGDQPAEGGETTVSDETTDSRTELFKEIEGLREARRELIHELGELRGQKREAKEEQIAKVQADIDQKTDDLSDVNKDDAALVDRIVRSKGYVSKQDVEKMFYDARKQEAISKFLSDYPEYSESSDPDRRRFGPLLREVQLYKEPSDPNQWSMLLKRAHESLTGGKSPRDRGTQVQKRQTEIAGVGAGGAQRSTSQQTFDAEKRAMLRAGGWSEEDIQSMEKRHYSQQ